MHTLEITQTTLPFDTRRKPVYPEVPGARLTDTSQATAGDIKPKAATIRDKVVDALHAKPMTADECAHTIGYGILAVRPRFSELRDMGRVVDTGTRRKNGSGKRAIVWRVVG